MMKTRNGRSFGLDRLKTPVLIQYFRVIDGNRSQVEPEYLRLFEAEVGAVRRELRMRGIHHPVVGGQIRACPPPSNKLGT